MTKIRTHYDNLKVTRNAPDIVIKAAHKALLQMHHPDKASDKIAAERITRILNEARDVLLDPARRKQHDDWIKGQEHHHTRPAQEHAAGTTEDYQEPPEKRPQGTAQADQEQLIGKYTASTNGTATDTETRLVWCRFALGQTWDNDAVHGDARVYTWQDAFDAVQAFNGQGGYAGHTDWRMPDISELKALLDRQAGTAKTQHINHAVFPRNPPWVWSCSPYAGYGGGSWFVNFNEGLALNENPSFHRAVRLVRG
ncbi:MAG: DUF1566 domain-containing protein [Methylovulum sp.]|nr:DUF1566 domain-containing protein [Methylovulum sp.]